ncbi:MAG: Conjugal transfer TrbH family protein [Polaromonas sp.]|nr:Conjugal transfer TrbH family protein [Polaromonas sp.]
MPKNTFLALHLAGLAGLVGLAGCATPGLPAYGNFTQGAPAAMQQTLADDAVKQLAALYPPASTRLDLQQATPDAFGSRLVESLRAKGYALLEFKPGAKTAALPSTATATATDRATDRTASAGKPLRYIVDQFDANLYRLTVRVGDQSLTRAYAPAQSGTLRPAGAWVRKE